MSNNKIEHDYLYYNGIGNSDNYSTLPIQSLSASKKTKKWKEATMDALENIGLRQLADNIRFRYYRKMMDGQFTYSAVGIEETDLPWFNKKVKSLRDEAGIPTYLKHFDFIGIVVNALTGIYTEYEDKFVVDSRDEYATNEYIRQKTEMLHKYAQSVFIQEVNRLLIQRGVDPYKNDFQSDEEYQQYQQGIQEQVKTLTPPEIEEFLSKNFKVIATEWAQNTVEEDKERFGIPHLDRENFIDYLLTGRYFKHFGVGYDNYYIERWNVEETFFSQDVDARFPQNGEYVGRITNMSPSNILNRYGHLMTTAEQEGVGNYWNQSKYYDSQNGVRVETSNKPIEETVFGEPIVTPFHNFFDHEAIVQLEEASGIPLGKTTVQTADGESMTFDSWTPRLDDEVDFRSDLYTAFLRDDIEVRRDTVRVTEAYWRSYKRLAVLIFENEFGSISVELVTDDLLSEFLREKEIKKLRSVSLQDLQIALKENRLDEYLNTITYAYVPEAWKGIKIRGNGTTLKKDLYLDVRPLDYQIKGSESNIYDIRLPVAGIIDTGIAVKLVPYQQLHNICMNQITELLEKELGVFFAFDITGFPSEFQDETTEESIFRARDIIKDTGMLGLDLSRQNTAGNQPNIFQRHDVVYATQVQYRWTLAQQYKQEALSQIGITPQLLGQPSTYQTAEGVKQGLQASYALINPIFDKMSQAKAKEMELHIAVAQYCQANGKDNSVLFRKDDGSQRFLDIMAEDGELFPLRWLGVQPMSSSKDRKIIENLKQAVLSDNTLTKSMADTIDILTNETIVEIKDLAKQIEAKTQKQVQEERQFQSDQLQKQLQANAEEQQKERDQEILLKQMDSETKLKEAIIQSRGRLADSQNADLDVLKEVEKANQNTINNDFRQNEINVKQQEVDRKTTNDIEVRNAKLKELQLKVEELRIRNKALDVQKETSIINKN